MVENLNKLRDGAELDLEEMIDLEISLKSKFIENRERVFFTLHYVMGMNMLECSNYFDLSLFDGFEIDKSLRRKLVMIENGEATKSSSDCESPLTPSYQFIERVQEYLVKRQDANMLNAIGEGECSLPPLEIVETKAYYQEAIVGQKKNASNDQFYAKDLRNGVSFNTEYLERAAL